MIVGKKVRFRALEDADQPLLAQWLNDPEISHLVGGWTFPVSVSGQRDWFTRAKGDPRNQRWIVETFAGEPIGLTGLWDIDWQNRHALSALKLGSKDLRGKGYGTDAILTLMSYAFMQVGLNRLWSEILPYNHASYRAYVGKCGWRVEGTNRQHVFRDGVFHDQLSIGVLRDEFLSWEAAKEYIPLAPKDYVDILPEHRIGQSR